MGLPRGEEEQATPANLHILVNPTASNGNALLAWEKVKVYLDSIEFPYQYAISESTNHLTELASLAARPGAIIAALGGDGTISTVVSAIADTGAILGVIPGGTGNDFARTFSIPHDPVDACRILLDGKSVPVDIGRINGTSFINVVGAGLDAEVVADANRTFKRFSGSLAYLLSLLRQLISFQPRQFRISVDGQMLESKAWMVTVANARYYGSGMEVAPGADPHDGLAEVIIVRNIHRLHFLRLFPLVYRGMHIDHPAVTVLRGSAISVECDQKSFVHADGDVVGMAPLSVAMCHHVLHMMVPKSYGISKNESSEGRYMYKKSTMLS